MKKEHKLNLACHLIQTYPTQSLREYLAYHSFHQDSITSLQNHNNVQPTLAFQIEVDVGDGQSQTIEVNQDTDILAEAKSFCQRHNLQPFVANLLADSIRQKYQKECLNNQIEHKQNQDEGEEEFKQSNLEQIIHVSPKQQISDYQNCSVKQNTPDLLQGADRILSRSLKRTRRSKVEDKIINNISEQICRKVGKSNIIQYKERKSRQKIEHVLRERTANLEKQMEECAFHPKINAISKIVDLEKNFNKGQTRRNQRFQQLYDNHKHLQIKKQISRKNSLNQISFKPTINTISRIIIQNKREKQDDDEKDRFMKSRHKSNAKHKHCWPQENKRKPSTGRKPKNRNKENLPIGDYLYQQANKKSSSKFYEEKVTIKAIDYSDQIVTGLKQKAINELFTEITSFPHSILTVQQVQSNLGSFQISPFRYFLPIFHQMLEMRVNLNREEFLETSLRLFLYLTPEQKSQIILKRDKWRNEDESMYKNVSFMNKKSRQIMVLKNYQKIDIYSRAKIQESKKEEKIQKNREQQVRGQLKGCTFRPFIINRD